MCGVGFARETLALLATSDHGDGGAGDDDSEGDDDTAAAADVAAAGGAGSEAAEGEEALLLVGELRKASRGRRAGGGGFKPRWVELSARELRWYDPEVRRREQTSRYELSVIRFEQSFAICYE